ncbi:MAG: ABC transporter substrate-binding protein [Eudoraea sp.]|nr:ABC transporter substrate-binding protein [Eudoraea sp.]
MKKVRIAGVPEHFNLPWHLAMEEGAFADRGIDLEWQDIPEGTGRMSQLLRDNETDLAIILTEGIIKSITEGNPVKIVQEYIATPLLWGIHVAANSSFRTIGQLQGTKAAISRYGSGSHLMAYINAQNQGWPPHKLQFEVVNDLEGAIKALVVDQAQYFMWEHFTTKPLVDKGVFRRVEDCPTPWPCFVIAARDAFIDNNKELLLHILEIINLYTREFKQIPSINRTLANRYGLQLADVDKWLSITRWSQANINIQDIENVQDTLSNLKLIDNKLPAEQIMYF